MFFLVCTVLVLSALREMQRVAEISGNGVWHLCRTHSEYARTYGQTGPCCGR